VFNPMEEDVPALIHELTGRGADAGIETSGAPTAARSLALSMRSRGKLSVVAWAGDVVFPPLVPQGLDIFGVWHWNSLNKVEEMWRTVRKAGDKIDTMVTHVMPLEDVSAAMDIQDRGECGKIFLLPHGEDALRAAG
jgi:threonine dehydrogenase-like Zn-dependent dehydrogenase